MGEGPTFEGRIEDGQIERDLEMFLSLANHDLQAPLRTLRSFVELAAEEHPSLFLDEAMSIASRLQALIRATLTYGRLHHYRLRLRRVALADAIAAGMDRAGVELAESAVQVQIASGLPSIVADRALLGMSIEAVLDNAARFAHPDRRPRLHIDAEARGDRIRLRICDNGIGVAAADRERCFEPMSRLSTPASGPSNGFGLAIVRRACALMHGTCGMQDAPWGDGICVWLDLPAAPPDGADGSTAGSG